jgi:signal transduction histidine kinase
MEDQRADSSSSPGEFASPSTHAIGRAEGRVGEEADGERDDLFARVAAGLAHEIKNPLSTMAINLALLEEEWGGASKSRGEGGLEPTAREKRCRKRIQTLQREVQRLETIVDDFLRYARGGVIDRAPHDLVHLVREVLDFVDAEDARVGIRHHADLPPGLPLVRLDAVAFRQAILNLLVNARQAMPMGGELIVRLRRQGNLVELSVTDTGVGMSPEDVERCFEVYFSTKREGTGLGLSTTKRIVEEHGGKIHVISEVGRGTSFSILLPLLVEIHHTRSAGESLPAAAPAPADERPPHRASPADGPGSA